MTEVNNVRCIMCGMSVTDLEDHEVCFAILLADEIEYV